MKSSILNIMTKEEPRSLPSFFKIFKRKFKKNDNDNNLRETIEELIDEVHEVEPSIESNERELLGNVLNLRDLTAYDVMLPRADIIAVPLGISAQDMIQQFVKTGVLQILIYKDNLDNVVGMLHVKDILAWQISKKPWALKTLMRNVLYISPTMRTLDLLLKMRETGSKVAVVVDEYGGVDGLVTFSNLIEEIIGDIQDAREQSPSVQIEIRTDGTIFADARTTLEELNKAVGVELPLNDHDDDIDTLGGLVVLLAGRVPIRGEVIRHPTSGIEFEVMEADPRKIRRVCIRQK
ncbi:hemolysin family protein [Candidatus Finniella inopinata]|uniref:HlyC/CorC family transporter n=1 Tax=Candidatus Finniella inopinata TaxID=1696036 RepID=A0A4Q7DND9_9PROT|nr:hemolysin family protein [Candidatus Finniella inopinata]RZI46376.1 HlyC/CorC family transporter [Candidatus Finniella inopinata]